MKNSRGFVVYDTILAMNVVMIVALVIVPLYFILQQEKQVLEDRTVITLHLFNELQSYIRNDDVIFPINEVKVMNDRTVTLMFNKRDNYIEGCAKWENVRKRSENYCLYGLSEN